MVAGSLELHDGTNAFGQKYFFARLVHSVKAMTQWDPGWHRLARGLGAGVVTELAASWDVGRAECIG